MEDQLSKELLESIAIVPNLQEKTEDDEQKNLITEVLPENTIVWPKNPEIIIGRLNELFSLISQESQNNAQDLSRIYASGKDGYAVDEIVDEPKNIFPLLDLILAKVLSLD